ncbi:MAG: glycosyltransferase [Ignavibacterium sp.]|jgi:cellulose synthase/poly-beta-1,6-N-acetylglucosamine synthase-like glycosyltransferase|uniref:cellulose synthase family protein n=1 Tax=Ignavibacterium album TaxID=591197 RepID=UPI0026EEADA4|nr:glycosyltransferase [Ignavibacterium album]MCA2004277.1 glycosyltransferase [Ignavibacterium sp.]MCX8104750.1 glycosyltransferase [Ignavibacterium album]
MDDIVLIGYFLSLTILFVFGLHGFIMLYYHKKYRDNNPVPKPQIDENATVTIQLPLYNELYVAERLIKATCEIEYPKDKLEIQVLDDSTDETTEIVANIVKQKQAEGFDIKHIRRGTREGFKAGALKYGLERAKGEFVAIFDADFIPHKDFLKKTLSFFTDEKVGLVQTRWEHLNGDYSILTKAQALALDGHFVIEQTVRNKAGFFINFNGTGGIWRKTCIEDAGNWHADTLTEDLDLSYRAQLKGWRFVFLKDFTSPAELPSEINALKSQQFRWTKGAVETAKKILPLVWKSDIPLRVKLQSTFHLTNNLVFPFILLAAILNVPLIFIKNSGSHEAYFAIMSIFVLAFISSFLFYMYAQKDIRTDWRKKIVLFPLFMAGSMGFAVNNSRAVIEGLLNRKSEFVRTPKFRLESEKDSWMGKKYLTRKVGFSVIVEALLAVYCLIGVISSIYFMELAAIPFQLLFFLGFAFVSITSIKHAYASSKK